MHGFEARFRGAHAWVTKPALALAIVGLLVTGWLVVGRPAVEGQDDNHRFFGVPTDFILNSSEITLNFDLRAETPEGEILRTQNVDPTSAFQMFVPVPAGVTQVRFVALDDGEVLGTSGLFAVTPGGETEVETMVFSGGSGDGDDTGGDGSDDGGAGGGDDGSGGGDPEIAAGASVPLPAGLGTLGWCGAATTTEQLFDAFPSLDAVFLLDGERGVYDVSQRALPDSIRPDLVVGPGVGMFVRTSQGFNIGMPPAEGGGLEVSGGRAFIDVRSSIELIANCGDTQLNIDLLEGNAGIDRVMTFDPNLVNWTIVGTILPEALRRQVLVRSFTAFAVGTTGATVVQLPCESSDCQAVVGGG